MKKKLMAIALAVCVVAVLAAGASLAYFTDKTTETDNVFVMGNVKITLDETNIKEDKGDHTVRTSVGNTYTNLYPGMDMVKDPIVHNTGKNDAWVRVIVRVTNGDSFMELFEDDQYETYLEGLTHGLGEGWSVDDYDKVWAEDGNWDLVYTIVYDKVLAADEDTPAVFEKLYIPASFDNDQMAAISTYDENGEYTGSFTMSIRAEAIQADGLDVETCHDAFLNWED